MFNLRNILLAVAACLLPMMATAQTQSINVVSTDIVGTYLETEVPTVRALAAGGAGISTACLPLVQISRNTFYECYTTDFLAIDGQGETFLMANGERGLIEGVVYIVPIPLTFGVTGEALAAARALEARADQIVQAGLSVEDAALLALIPLLSERLGVVEGKVTMLETAVTGINDTLTAQNGRMDDQSVRLQVLETFNDNLNLDQFLSEGEQQQKLIEFGLLDSDGQPVVGLTEEQRVVLVAELRQSLSSDFNLEEFLTGDDFTQKLIDTGLLDSDGQPISEFTEEQRATLQQLFDSDFNPEEFLTGDDLEQTLIEAGLLDSDGKPLVGQTNDSMTLSESVWYLFLAFLVFLAFLLLLIWLMTRNKTSAADNADYVTKADHDKLAEEVRDEKTGLPKAHVKGDQALAATKQNATAITALASRFKHNVTKIDDGEYRTLRPAEIKKLDVGSKFSYHILVGEQHVALPAKIEHKTDKGEVVVMVKPFEAEPPLKVGSKSFHKSLADLIEEHGMPDTVTVSEPNAIAAE